MADKSKKEADTDSLEGSSSIVEPSTPDKDTTKNTDASADEDSLSNPKETTSPASEPGQQPPHRAARVLGFMNLYFVIFILLLLIGIGGIFAAYKLNNKSSDNQVSKSQSLTDKQLADLKSNTTLVGDAQQTLDIQGNSIFEGQVLMRNNLDVAGSIKIGGSLSLPAITVGGTSNFGQIHVNDQLSVSGNTILQGTLTVQKGLTVTGPASFGTVSASQINASSLQLSGDFIVSRHIDVSGGTPSRSGGTALGGGGTASVSGADTSGTVTINTGGSPPAGCFITINFTQKFNTTPHVVISPSNSSAGSLEYYANRSNTSFSICTANAPTGSTTYLFDYIAID
jgi:cytoskeletal protein CcmA (bactofilin family)